MNPDRQQIAAVSDRMDEDAIILAMCKAHDREEAAQMGEPSPWLAEADSDWERGRYFAMREAFDVAEAALSAALAAAPTRPAMEGVVKVKPLEWAKHPTAEAWRCDNMFGTYQVWAGPLNTVWQFDGSLGERINKPATNELEAKSAAQQHFNAAILSCLSPTGTEELRAENERLKEYARAATATITNLTGGGSENFGKRIGDIFTADLDLCERRIRERFERGAEAQRELVRCKKELAGSSPARTALSQGEG